MQSKADLQLLCVDPSLAAGIWPLVRERLQAAVDGPGLGDFADVESEVMSGLQLIWLASDGTRIEAAMTTRLTLAGGHKVCTLVTCAGTDRRRWLALHDGIEQYARAEGCTKMRIYGRKGWLRVLKDYFATHYILEKVLN